MNIGMLWLNTDEKKTFDQCLQAAVLYYKAKYSKIPDTCYVNDKHSGPLNVGGISIVPSKTIIAKHLWLGVSSEP